MIICKPQEMEIGEGECWQYVGRETEKRKGGIGEIKIYTIYLMIHRGG